MTFKDYAKQAKERLKNGFWIQIQQEREYSREVAATCGSSVIPILVSHKDRIRNQIYSKNFQEEMEFERKVIDLISKNEVTNPILQLADKNILASLSPSRRQAYLMELSTKYRKVKERYLQGK